MSRATRQPGPRLAKDTVVIQITAPPGTLPLERLQPPAPKAVRQRDQQPLLDKNEPSDHSSQVPKLGLIDDRLQIHVHHLGFAVGMGILGEWSTNDRQSLTSNALPIAAITKNSSSARASLRSMMLQ